VKQLREVCLAQVQYDLDILGMKGPRNMHILAARPHDNVYEVLKSKKAAWDGQLKSYVLDFHGRASQVCVCVCVLKGLCHDIYCCFFRWNKL
jgi:hypothetical protein